MVHKEQTGKTGYRAVRRLGQPINKPFAKDTSRMMAHRNLLTMYEQYGNNKFIRWPLIEPLAESRGDPQNTHNAVELVSHMVYKSYYILHI